MYLKKMLQRKFKDKRFLSVFLLIIFGSLTWSLTMVKSGLIYDFGIGFWGPNGHDGVWHIALSNSLAKGSWEMPMFAGEIIKNYHLGFDLILAILHKLTLIPIHTLYFQIIPPALSFLIGVSVYKFVLLWQTTRLRSNASARQAKTKAYWAVFFVYFGGSFGWLVNLIRNKRMDGESLFWSQQSISTLLNPPFALSILVIFVALTFLVKGLRSGSKKYLTMVTFLFGVLIQIKIYAGLLCLGALFVSGFMRMLRRKGTLLIKVFSGALIVSILLYPSLLTGAGKTIEFKPFWFLETMMQFQDRLNWPKFGEAMVNYKLGGVWMKGIVAYFVALLIFIIGNFGTRTIGLFWFKNKVRNFVFRKPGFSEMDVFVISVILAGIIIPALFVQSGVPWNTIQFFYYSSVFSGILAGITFVDFARKFQKKTFVIYGLEILLIIFTVSTTYATLKNHYLSSRPPAKISSGELEALEFLSNQPEGVVLTIPFDRNAANAAIDNPPRPLYLYESTAYVSAFSGQKVYMEDEVNLEITGYNWRERRDDVIMRLRDQDKDSVANFMEGSRIKYIYWVKEDLSINLDSLLTAEKIFENSEVDIYESAIIE